MRGFSIKIEIVEDNIKVTKEELAKAIEAGLTNCGIHMERYAKQMCPVGNPANWKWPAPPGYVGGTLRSSIAYALDGKIPSIGETSGGGQQRTYRDASTGKKLGTYGTAAPKEKKGRAVYVGTNVYYAPYVEMGTSKMNARPFIEPAVVGHKDEYKNLLKEALEGTWAKIS